MTTVRKDIAAMAAPVLTVLTYLTTHEGWDVWQFGDNHRWAAGAIVLFGFLAFVAAYPGPGTPKTTYVVLAGSAIILAGVSFATGSLTPLSLLVAAIVVVWIVAVARDGWHGTHHPTAV